jgi:hypothetical protein
VFPIVVLSVTVGFVTTAMMATRGNASFETVSDLKQASSVGCVAGSTSCAFLSANGITQAVPCTEFNECTELIAHDKISAFVYDQPMLQYNVLQRQNGLGEYSQGGAGNSWDGTAPHDKCGVVDGILLNREDYGLGFKSHTKALTEAFNPLILGESA